MIVNILKSYARVCSAKSVVPLPPSLTPPERPSAAEATEMEKAGTRAGATGTETAFSH